MGRWEHRGETLFRGGQAAGSGQGKLQTLQCILAHIGSREEHWCKHMEARGQRGNWETRRLIHDGGKGEFGDLIQNSGQASLGGGLGVGSREEEGRGSIV